MSRKYALSLLPELKAKKFPFFLRVKLAKVMAKRDGMLNIWLNDHFPEGGSRSNCMDPQCTCDRTHYYEGTVKVRKTHKSTDGGPRRVSVKERRVRITVRAQGSYDNLVSFEYLT